MLDINLPRRNQGNQTVIIVISDCQIKREKAGTSFLGACQRPPAFRPSSPGARGEAGARWSAVVGAVPLFTFFYSEAVRLCLAPGLGSARYRSAGAAPGKGSGRAGCAPRGPRHLPRVSTPSLCAADPPVTGFASCFLSGAGGAAPTLQPSTGPAASGLRRVPRTAAAAGRTSRSAPPAPSGG